MRIVVAEDQRDEASRLTRLLLSLGHEVIVCQDGHAVLSSCLEERPQAVFLDLLLPGVDGFEVARRLGVALHLWPRGPGSSRDAGLPMLVAITSLRSRAAEEVAQSVGFRAFLHKPYTVDDLRLVLAPLSVAGQVNPERGDQKDG